MRAKEPKVNPITIIMNKIPFSIVDLIFKVVSNHSFKTFNKVLLSSLSIMTCWSTPIIEFSMNRVSSSPLLHRQDKLMYWESEERYSDKYSDIFCKSLRTTTYIRVCGQADKKSSGCQCWMLIEFYPSHLLAFIQRGKIKELQAEEGEDHLILTTMFTHVTSDCWGI